VVVVLGDSIGEVVQSADASAETQPYGYPNWVAFKLGAPFALPLIQSGPFETVGNTDGRSRIFPDVAGANLAVSGADVDSLLHDAADAATVGEINSETDLVLFPRLGSQMDVVEAWAPTPDIVLCWIGNNDVLGTALSYDQLDGSQLTDVAAFDEKFNEIAQRLGALGSKVVFANIPSVTSIGFLLDGQDLVRFLGSDFGLAEGSRTSVVTMFLIKLGLDDGSLLSDPDYVLDAGEIAAIQDRIEVFNDIIAAAAADIDAPVVNAKAIFDFMVSNPPEILGIPLSHRFLGGVFSLDGVHPSNTIHAVIANEFIKALNRHYEMSVPEITGDEFFFSFWFDPHIDKDGDGKVTGRLFAGLLETLGPFLGFSGDLDDIVASPSTSVADGPTLLQRYNRLQSRRAVASTDTRSQPVDIIHLLESAFGVKK
jgi:lysophospholipase L1-like esterase